MIDILEIARKHGSIANRGDRDEGLAFTYAEIQAFAAEMQRIGREQGINDCLGILTNVKDVIPHVYKNLVVSFNNCREFRQLKDKPGAGEK
jgi:hypothetical protein